MYILKANPQVSRTVSGIRPASHHGKPGKEFGLLANFVKEGSRGQVGYVIGYFEVSMGTGTPSMDNPVVNMLFSTLRHLGRV